MLTIARGVQAMARHLTALLMADRLQPVHRHVIDSDGCGSWTQLACLPCPPTRRASASAVTPRHAASAGATPHPFIRAGYKGPSSRFISPPTLMYPFFPFAYPIPVVAPQAAAAAATALPPLPHPVAAPHHPTYSHVEARQFRRMYGYRRGPSRLVWVRLPPARRSQAQPDDNFILSSPSALSPPSGGSSTSPRRPTLPAGCAPSTLAPAPRPSTAAPSSNTKTPRPTRRADASVQGPGGARSALGGGRTKKRRGRGGRSGGPRRRR